MSNTPIVDFLKKYRDKEGVRLHMPGHKGKGTLGCEEYDITEIHGADSLFEAEGIICESEGVLSDIYNTRASFYSTEGSSLCIRAMVFLSKQYSGTKKKLLAGRNAHKSFVSALALCDAEADWLYGEDLYSCNITPALVEASLKKDEYFAVYVTSPDYLGNVLDVKSLSEVCHKYGVPLLVDNAHGAYLKFVGNHPMDNGADMCCDSAHKTLPCLTGAAYLHVSKNSIFPFERDAKRAMSLFASTSPSYLIMASMDKANEIMKSEEFSERISFVSRMCDELKTSLSHMGIAFSGNEKLKINIKPKSFGYEGNELCRLLEKDGIYPEFCDKDNLVLMFSANNDKRDFERTERFFSLVEKKAPLPEKTPEISAPGRKMSVREAVFSAQKTVNTKEAEGRILASPCVSCPPAIPIAVCGEVLDKKVLDAFRYYGIEKVQVVE